MVLNECNPNKVGPAAAPCQPYVRRLQRSAAPELVQDDIGQPTNWGDVDPALLYGLEGWCEAKEAPQKRCGLMA